MTILLSIKPQYADAIFHGDKRYEFRRSIFKQKVTRVVVYATAPVAMVIGEFTIEDILHDDVERLWESTQPQAGIDRSDFFSYFNKKTKGYAIVIGKVTHYKTPKSLNSTYGVKAPQSFLYLDN